MSEPDPLPPLRLVTADERALLTPDPVDDLDLGDFVSVAERELQVDAMFVAAMDSAEAVLRPWLNPEDA
ncbi:hypothetical protein ACX3O0_01270 [Homoserinimonas sp. A447]